MRKILFSFLLLFTVILVHSQDLADEESYRKYFQAHAESLDPVEGIWTVATTQEFYRYDTLYDVVHFPKAARVAIIKKDSVFLSFNLNGESYNVEFQPTAVIGGAGSSDHIYIQIGYGVYLYRNYFNETHEYSQAQAVISRVDEMEYTYDFPDAYLKVKLGESYEEGTRVVNLTRWTKIFPDGKKK